MEKQPGAALTSKDQPQPGGQEERHWVSSPESESAVPPEGKPPNPTQRLNSNSACPNPNGAPTQLGQR